MGDDIMSRNELNGDINAISGREKSDLQPEEIQGSPKFDGTQCWS